MAPNPRRLRERLQSEVYDHIPQIVCKGLCQQACSIIPCTVAETEAMEREAGHPLFVEEGLRCSMLENSGACSVYGLRPTICRMYGTVVGMECPFGCVPERLLSREESKALLVKADEIGGVNENERRQMIRFLDRLHTILTINEGR